MILVKIVEVPFKRLHIARLVLCDRPGEGSSEKICCWWLTFQQPEWKSSSAMRKAVDCFRSIEFLPSIKSASGKCFLIQLILYFHRLSKEMCFGNEELTRFVCTTSILVSCTFECNSCLISKNFSQINQRLPMQFSACQWKWSSSLYQAGNSLTNLTLLKDWLLSKSKCFYHVQQRYAWQSLNI